MVMTEHQIIVEHPFPQSFPQRFYLRCSCPAGILFNSLDRAVIPYEELSAIVAEHLKPELDKALKEIFRHISIKDVIREILKRRNG